MSCSSNFGSSQTRNVDDRIYRWSCPSGTASGGLRMQYTDNSKFVDNEAVSMSCCPVNGNMGLCQTYNHNGNVDNDGTLKKENQTREWNCPAGNLMTGIIMKPDNLGTSSVPKFKTYGERIGVNCCANPDVTGQCTWSYFMTKDNASDDLKMICPSGSVMSGVRYRIGGSGKLRDEEVSVKCCELSSGSPPSSSPPPSEPLRMCTSNDYSWGPCSAECGGGTMDRIKKTGVSCDGPNVVSGMGTCNEQECVVPIPDCTSNDYAWSSCTSECGVSMSKELRKKTGVECQGPVVKDSSTCPDNPCPCSVSDYYWTTCSKNCGGGTREFKKMPGRECSGDDILSSEPCNEHDCPDVIQNTDCEYDSWGNWNECSNKCGSGTQSRSRTIQTNSSGTGTPCQDSDLVETEQCSGLSGCPDDAPDEEQLDRSLKKKTVASGATTNYYDYDYQITSDDDDISYEEAETITFSGWWIIGGIILLLILIGIGYYMFGHKEEVKNRFTSFF